MVKKKSHDLGSAKFGTEHWWHQRVTAIALVLLLLYLMTTFISSVVFGNGYEDAVNWIQLFAPIGAVFIILFLVAAFYHAVLGLQVVIEDYVHGEGMKLASILAVKFIGASFAVLGILSVIKILFWSLLPNAAPPPS